MQRDQFAAGHRWENKVPDYKVTSSYEEVLPIPDTKPAKELAAGLEAMGYDAKMLHAKFTISFEKPKLV